MTQAILESVATPSMDNKTYSVNVKGLMKHFADVLFGKTTKSNSYVSDTSNLSSHLQKDLGLY
ncbi:hypothetical protein A1QC_02810 [Vibrio rumoiensis 1S-45]|uniref:Uncharacterized protein n=1 Tax=Vibrio rumoiensis 1S-45 TaxID=1188252 RepID=A0A1E5DZZ5_9VIBR|nr:hypothetical protein A1QC_02810 [Vibrio rumoiensis 1S-45]